MPRTELTIPVGPLKLEAVLHQPDGQGPWPGVVVCHPHPRGGGDMNNNVVLAVSSALERAGIAALRYNCRGVGRSQGELTAGPEDTEDAIQVVEHLASTEGIDASRVAVCGYSFGGRVALGVAQRSPTVQAVCGIGTPIPSGDDPALQQLPKPKLFIVGQIDQFIPEERFRAFTDQLAPPKEAHVLPDADHFFQRHEREVGELVASFLSRWLTQANGPG